MNTLVKSILKNVLDDNQKIKLPVWSNKIKLDVGTSLNAPNSEMWLSREDDLVVFGFEPNIFNIKTLYEGQDFWPFHLKKERIDYSFFCVNCALSDKESENEKFYCTGNGNPGTSSLFKPKTFEVLDVIDVPVITLESYFDLFPWDKIPYVSQLKIDAQESDFNIIKGCGKYLKERIVYIDVETTTGGQYYSDNNSGMIRDYLENNDFECTIWGGNATFINKNFKNILNKIDYFILGE